MRRLLLAAFTIAFGTISTPAFSYTAVWCLYDVHALFLCYSSSAATGDDADRAASEQCEHSRLGTCERAVAPFAHQCLAVGHHGNSRTLLYALAPTILQAQANISCPSGDSCNIDYVKCDFDLTSPVLRPQVLDLWDSLNYLTKGIFIGLGIFIVGAVYATRAPILNFIIHGNLPYKLPVYGEDIQCLFKRTQRVNWYGRVIFGVVANLAMTHQQLIDVRKYWLGRVIAFDSLRRQRQNELARMHLQLAASVKSDPHDKKKFWSRRWATFRTFLRRLFWIFTAFFSFLLGFFFIRITIAKIVRGTIIESTDLVLVLQAKDAIEESTTYLKEYLTTANTFDGGDEIYEPK
jgi:hypothetical protein